MKIRLVFQIILIACQHSLIAADLKGDYFGQTPPEKEAQVFAKGIVSTDMNEVNAAFTSDGKEFYFSRFTPGFGYKIMQMRQNEGTWSLPQIAPFSGQYSEVDIFVAPGDKQLFFVSKRPVPDTENRSPGYQIWRIEKSDHNWNKPVHLGSVINFGNRQLYPSLSTSGSLYFNSDGPEGNGKGDFYKSVWQDDHYTPPENLGDSINTVYDETDIFIAPDETYVLFTSVGRPEGLGGGDLYVSFQKSDHTWSKAIPMGEAVNTTANEYSPVVSPDGKYLFFTSNRNGNDDIFWVTAQIIDTYKEGYFR